LEEPAFSKKDCAANLQLSEFAREEPSKSILKDTATAAQRLSDILAGGIISFDEIRSKARTYDFPWLAGLGWFRKMPKLKYSSRHF
jgi:hypothetical protein